MEIYKSIDDYDNYEVSNMGNVRNKKTGLILKQMLHNGYYYVGLSKNSKNKLFDIHRLIASYFIPNPNNKSVIKPKHRLILSHLERRQYFITNPKHPNNKVLIVIKNTPS